MPRPTIDSTAPTGSSRCGWRSLLVGTTNAPSTEGDDRDGDVDRERRAPPEVLDQPAAEHQAERTAAAGDAGPDGDGLGPLAATGSS